MRDVISTKDAPQAIGPYSQAIRANGFVFVSGQVAIDPATQQVITGDITAQTDRVLRNLSAILKAAGSGLGKVVRSTVFLKDMGDFTAAISQQRRQPGQRSRPHACPRTFW
jgi:2-iminobutanoate/2-iminopropanoate deaminase